MNDVFELTVNKIERIRIKYADQFQGNKGPRLKLKAWVDGESASDDDLRCFFLPIAVAGQLAKYGARALETAKGTTYKVDWNTLFAIEKHQEPGDKYPQIQVW